eukprot:TRINITY_DN4297_c1_g1_i1.p1 TRINITY_DN4297_c1_g1~~TRINITY_DN4297_c1_g1_i1.p1  ORF type:complete len:852 (+),score=234.27 TRINITY_DN4297_c1_g1_i1:44-2557(+)
MEGDRRPSTAASAAGPPLLVAADDGRRSSVARTADRADGRRRASARTQFGGSAEGAGDDGRSVARRPSAAASAASGRSGRPPDADEGRRVSVARRGSAATSPRRPSAAEAVEAEEQEEEARRRSLSTDRRESAVSADGSRAGRTRRSRVRIANPRAADSPQPPGLAAGDAVDYLTAQFGWVSGGTVLAVHDDGTYDVGRDGGLTPLPYWRSENVRKSGLSSETEQPVSDGQVQERQSVHGGSVVVPTPSPDPPGGAMFIATACVESLRKAASDMCTDRAHTVAVHGGCHEHLRRNAGLLGDAAALSRSVVVLDLDGHLLKDYGVGALCRGLGRNRSIRELRLRDNGIADLGLAHLVRALVPAVGSPAGSARVSGSAHGNQSGAQASVDGSQRAATASGGSPRQSAGHCSRRSSASVRAGSPRQSIARSSRPPSVAGNALCTVDRFSGHAVAAAPPVEVLLLDGNCFRDVAAAELLESLCNNAPALQHLSITRQPGLASATAEALLNGRRLFVDARFTSMPPAAIAELARRGSGSPQSCTPPPPAPRTPSPESHVTVAGLRFVDPEAAAAAVVAAVGAAVAERAGARLRWDGLRRLCSFVYGDDAQQMRGNLTLYGLRRLLRAGGVGRAETAATGLCPHCTVTARITDAAYARLCAALGREMLIPPGCVQEDLCGLVLYQVNGRRVRTVADAQAAAPVGRTVVQISAGSDRHLGSMCLSRPSWRRQEDLDALGERAGRVLMEGALTRALPSRFTPSPLFSGGDWLWADPRKAPRVALDEALHRQRESRGGAAARGGVDWRAHRDRMLQRADAAFEDDAVHGPISAVYTPSAPIGYVYY